MRTPLRGERRSATADGPGEAPVAGVSAKRTDIASRNENVLVGHDRHSRALVWQMGLLIRLASRSVKSMEVARGDVDASIARHGGGTTVEISLPTDIARVVDRDGYPPACLDDTAIVEVEAAYCVSTETRQRSVLVSEYRDSYALEMTAAFGQAFSDDARAS